MTIKVVIVDDHPLVINGLTNLLHSFPKIEVIGTYSTATALLQGMKQAKPDVVLLDIHLPDNNGGEVARQISRLYPNTAILVLTALQSLEHIKAMIQYGCTGYLFKSSANEITLPLAIEEVHKGNIYIDPSVQQSYMRSMLRIKNKSEQSPPQLTRREQEILKLIAEEYTNQAIAEKLLLSQRTVEGHRLSIMQKLDVKNTVGLIKVALKMGIIM